MPVRVAILSESALERVGNCYYAVDPWIRFIEQLAGEARVTLLAPVRSPAAPQDGAWRVDDSMLAISPLAPYSSYAEFAFVWLRARSGWIRTVTEAVREADIVAIRLPSPSVGAAMRIAERERKPVVLLVAGDMLTQSDRILGSRGVRRLAYTAVVRMLVRREIAYGRRAAHVFAYSAELLERHRNARVSRMRTPHLSDRDIVRRDDTCRNEEIKLLRVCWLLPSKGIETLLDAVARLTSRGIRVHLTIVGRERRSGYERHLQEYAARAGAAACVTFRGWVPFDRMQDVYLESDVQVVSSLAEGTPRCIVEGMARGVPVVSTRVGGCADVLRDETDALLVPPQDAGAMSDAIERVVRNGDLRRRLIRNGYAVAADATFDRAGRRFLDQLRSLVDGAYEATA